MTKLSTLSSHLWCKWCYPVWQLSVHIFVVAKLCSLSRRPLQVGGFQWRRDNYHNYHYNYHNYHHDQFPPWSHRPESDNIVISIFSSLYFNTLSPVSAVYRAQPWPYLAVRSEGKSSTQPVSSYLVTREVWFIDSSPPVMTTLELSVILQAYL